MTEQERKFILDEIKASIKVDRKYFDNDHYAVYHLIYADGSQIVASDIDIASGAKKVSLQGIRYARKEDGDGEEDTETGYNFMTGWTSEQKEDYYRMIEQKYCQ